MCRAEAAVGGLRACHQVHLRRDRGGPHLCPPQLSPRAHGREGAAGKKHLQCLVLRIWIRLSKSLKKGW